MTTFQGIREARPPEKIEKEDVQGPRAVRQMGDIVIVLGNPYRGEASQYLRDTVAETEEPNFAVSKSRGFQVYAMTSIEPHPNDPEGEPVFKGSIYADRVGPPNYRIQVTL